MSLKDTGVILTVGVKTGNKTPVMIKFLSICTYSNTTQCPVQSIFIQLNIYMSLDHHNFKSLKDTNKDQDSLQPHSCHVSYANEIHSNLDEIAYSFKKHRIP